MASPYSPLKITGMTTGLVQNREEFLLPEDAYPVLQNAFIFRERIKRRQGFELLGRLRRVQTAQALGNADGGGDFTGNIVTVFTLGSTATIQAGSVVVTDGVNTFTDNGLGVLVGVPAGSGTINYSTGSITTTGSAPAAALTVSYNYFPGLPVMGLRTREQTTISNEMTVAFDTVYAYKFVATQWQEFIPGTTWTGNDSDFFWSTNYWVSDANVKIFWVTNDSGTTGDPIRYTDGTVWIDFAPQIDAAGNRLEQALAILPFRGRLLVFNTLEGPNLAGSISYSNRIRWAAIGTPFSDVSAIVASVNANAWRDDIRGQGGFLDIPTSEEIVAVGFVRDNLVIYCERSTWQLRYTGRSIAPFQIEKVNSELGAESTFSAVQFDTSLVGVGDKGIVECDSFKSDRIDIKIPDLVFQFNNENNGTKRVHGIRDFVQRVAYWIYPYNPSNGTFPDRRLVYNYENDSWAIYTDSLTAMGTFQPPSERTWANTVKPWNHLNFSWVNRPSLIPDVIGGNQQGFTEYIGGDLEGGQTTNDPSLYISAITSGSPNTITITSPNHNMQTGYVVSISNIPAGTSFETALNENVYGVVVTGTNTFEIYSYNPATKEFDAPVVSVETGYVGDGLISVRDNFIVQSKKFNNMDEGESTQLGYIDVLMPTTDNGAITLNVYQNYDENSPTNTLPENDIDGTQVPDDFFNSVIPTSASALQLVNSTKTWQRVFCTTRANFITIEYTLSNSQMAGDEQESDVQIDAQVIWKRKAGRLTSTL